MGDPCILIADDDAGILSMLSSVIGRQGWGVVTAPDGEEALHRLRSETVDVAILDLKMPKMNGLEVLQAVKTDGTNPVDVVMLTGYGTVGTAVAAMKAGARDFLTKPVRMDEVVGTVRRLLERRSLPPHALATRLDTYLRAHASDRGMQVDELCGHFRISRRYVTKLFSEHIGMSFRARLCQYRVEKARHLVESTDLPLYIVAEQCGFRDYRQLAASFRKLEGMLPREYRKTRGK